jgi:hypothetical protein
VDQFGRTVESAVRRREKWRVNREFWKRSLKTTTIGVDPNFLVGPIGAEIPVAARPVLKLSPSNEPPNAALQEASPPSVDPPLVEVTARFVCARCKSPLAQGERTFKVSASSANVEIEVVPLCQCMVTWDGTGTDLLARQGPNQLLRHDGDAAGDGVPRGMLAVVVPEPEEK